MAVGKKRENLSEQTQQCSLDHSRTVTLPARIVLEKYNDIQFVHKIQFYITGKMLDCISLLNPLVSFPQCLPPQPMSPPLPQVPLWIINYNIQRLIFETCKVTFFFLSLYFQTMFQSFQRILVTWRIPQVYMLIVANLLRNYMHYLQAYFHTVL